MKRILSKNEMDAPADTFNVEMDELSCMWAPQTPSFLDVAEEPTFCGVDFSGHAAN